MLWPDDLVEKTSKGKPIPLTQSERDDPAMRAARAMLGSHLRSLGGLVGISSLPNMPTTIRTDANGTVIIGFEQRERYYAAEVEQNRQVDALLDSHAFRVVLREIKREIRRRIIRQPHTGVYGHEAMRVVWARVLAMEFFPCVQQLVTTVRLLEPSYS